MRSGFPTPSSSSTMVRRSGSWPSFTNGDVPGIGGDEAHGRPQADQRMEPSVAIEAAAGKTPSLRPSSGSLTAGQRDLIPIWPTRPLSGVATPTPCCEPEDSIVVGYTIALERAESGGFIVSVPALPGCVTQAESRDEARKNAREAIAVYLEELRVHGEDLPREVKAETEFLELPDLEYGPSARARRSDRLDHRRVHRTLGLTRRSIGFRRSDRRGRVSPLRSSRPRFAAPIVAAAFRRRTGRTMISTS